MDTPISNNLKKLIYTPDMPSIEGLILNNKDKEKKTKTDDGIYH